MLTKNLSFIIVATISLFGVSKSYPNKLDCFNVIAVERTYANYKRDSLALFSQFANLTLYENVTETLVEASSNNTINDTMLNVEDILPENAKLYLRRRPPTICGRPAIVNYHITVLALDTINEASMTYNLDVFLSVAWIDHRLRYPNSSARAYLILDPNWLGAVWQPDTVFKNAREVSFHERIIPNHFLWMMPNKALVYTAKLTLSLACTMEFSLYPHDTQECDMKMESMMYTTKELILAWDAYIPMDFTTKNKKVVTPQFRSVYNKTENCEKTDYKTGNFSCIRAVFYLRRSLGYHLIHTYFPSGLIVSLSWVTFWIKIKDIMPRIGLGVTTLLTMATLSSQSQASLPPVSYGKAIDTWMTICALFVFCSIIEFAIVNYIVSRFPDDQSIPLEPKNPRTCKERIQSYFSHRRIYVMAHNVDKVCRLLFPVCFLACNIWYWGKYLQENQINGVEVEREKISLT